MTNPLVPPENTLPETTPPDGISRLSANGWLLRGASLRLPKPSRAELLALLAIVLIGAALRAWQLGTKSLWLDELNLLRSSFGGGQLFSPFGLSLLDHPPGYMVILRVMLHISREDWWLRLPAMLTSVAALVAIWGTGRSFFGPLAGLFAAFILALSPMHIRYAQEAHSYGLYGLLSIVLLWMLYRAARLEASAASASAEAPPRSACGWLAIWLPFVVSAIVLLYVHYYSFFLVALSVALFPLFFLDSGGGSLSSLWREGNRRIAMGRMVIAMAVLALLYLPQVIFGVGASIQYAQNLDVSQADRSLLQSALWAARPITENWDLGYRFGVIAVIVVSLAGLVWLFWKRTALAAALVMILVLPVPPAIWMAFRTGIAYNLRRIVFTLPVLVLVMAVGIVALAELAGWLLGGGKQENQERAVRRSKNAATVAAVAMVVLFAGAAVAPAQGYYARPKQDWKTASEILSALVGPGDAPVSKPRAARNLSWYFPAIQPISGDLQATLEIACSLHGKTFLVVMPNEPLNSLEESWVAEHFIEIPLKDIDVWYRNCNEGVASATDGVEDAFEIAWKPESPYPPTLRAYEAYVDRGGSQAAAVPKPTSPPTPTVVIPTDQGPWVEAAALLRAGRNDEALAKYQQLVEEHPNHRGSMMGLAQALAAVERNDEALVLFDQVERAMARFRLVLYSAR